MSDQLERLTAALAERYRIDRELGAGGMATVYLAEDLKHNRKVAVKALKPDVTLADDPHTYAYIEREADSYLFELKGIKNDDCPHTLPGRSGLHSYTLCNGVTGNTNTDRNAWNWNADS